MGDQVIVAESPPKTLTDRSLQVERVALVQAWSTTSSTGEPTVVKVKLGQQPSAWLRSALQQISALTALAAGWDSYDAKPVSAEMVMEAVEFLIEIAYPDLARPSIVPLADGGLQVEWHRNGIDLEVTFSDEDAGVYVVDRNKRETVERPLSYAAFEVTRLAARLRDT
jgi:hypothetical protein